MDIRILQYFLAVAQEQSITRAAEALHMTQPPLSRSMKELEEELGVPLLVRSAKSVTLTEEGELLRDRAQQLVELFESTLDEMTSADDVLRGEVSIGCGETEAVTLLAEAARAMQARHPSVKYRLFSGDIERVLEKLDRGTADFGLLVDPFIDGERYRLLRLPLADRWGVIVGADHPFAGRTSIDAVSLHGERLFVPHQTYLRSNLLAWLGSSDEQRAIAGYYDLAYNASRFAREGVGCVLALDGIVHTGEGSGLAFLPLDPPLSAHFYLVWQRHGALSGPARAFLEEVRRVLKAHSADNPKVDD